MPACKFSSFCGINQGPFSEEQTVFSKTHYFRGRHFYQCFILSTALHFSLSFMLIIILSNPIVSSPFKLFVIGDNLTYIGVFQPPDDWPFIGDITVNNLEMRYSKELEPVLQNINIRIKGGEKVGAKNVLIIIIIVLIRDI